MWWEKKNLFESISWFFSGGFWDWGLLSGLVGRSGDSQVVWSFSWPMPWHGAAPDGTFWSTTFQVAEKMDFTDPGAGSFLKDYAKWISYIYIYIFFRPISFWGVLPYQWPPGSRKYYKTGSLRSLWIFTSNCFWVVGTPNNMFLFSKQSGFHLFHPTNLKASKPWDTMWAPGEKSWNVVGSLAVEIRVSNNPSLLTMNPGTFGYPQCQPFIATANAIS